MLIATPPRTCPHRIINTGDYLLFMLKGKVGIGKNYLTLIANKLCHGSTASRAFFLLSSLFCLINHSNLLLSAEKPGSLKFLLKYLFKNLYGALTISLYNSQPVKTNL